jgi:hypothetical protein
MRSKKSALAAGFVKPRTRESYLRKGLASREEILTAKGHR